LPEGDVAQAFGVQVLTRNLLSALH
jgi:hypothetical protein